MKNKFYLLLFSLIFLLLISNLVVSNWMSTRGERIKILEAKIKALKEENAFLELEIAQESSISGLIKRAENLGFAFSPQVLYLKGKLPVAMR